MVWVMVDIGPIMVDIIHLTMVVMVVAISQLYIFNEGTARKRLQNHSPTIGTTAAIRKAIIHMLKSVLTAGYRLPRSQRQIRARGGTPSLVLSYHLSM